MFSDVLPLPEDAIFVKCKIEHLKCVCGGGGGRRERDEEKAINQPLSGLLARQAEWLI